LAGDGFLVAIPEHAGTAGQSRRSVHLISYYGAADTVGLPPLAMRVWDDLSCLEYLAGREDVDKRSILIAGLGIGGADAAMTAVLDERIAAVAAVGAITVRDWAVTVAPRLGQFDRIMPYLPGIATKTDLQYVYAAVAPRPLLLVDGTDRANWPEVAYQRVRKQAEQVFALYGAAEKLTLTPAQSPWGIEELHRWAKADPARKGQ
jgi:dienelactone hydrolase